MNKTLFIALLFSFSAMGAVEISDDFSSNTAANYACVDSNVAFTVSGGEGHAIGYKYAYFYHTTAVSTADMYTQADVEYNSTNDDWSAIMVRSNGLKKTSRNCYEIFGSGDRYGLYRVINGSRTWLTEFNTTESNSSTTLKISAQTIGDTVRIIVWQGGTQRILYNDVNAARITAGSYGGGLIHNYNSGSDVRFDNFEVGTLADGGCTDSITYAGKTDSAAAWISHTGTFRCGGSAWAIWELANGTGRDSTILGTVDSGDVKNDTIRNLTYSTRYRFQMRLDDWLSDYDTSYTADSIDNDTALICFSPQIDSVSGPDSAVRGGLKTIIGIEFKSTGGICSLGDSGVTVVAQTDTTVQFAVPDSMPAGVYDIVFVDSCGNKDTLVNSLTIYTASPPLPVITSVFPPRWYRGKLIEIRTTNTPSPQGTGKVYFSTTIGTPTDSMVVAETWGTSLIKDTIPMLPQLPRKRYVWVKDRNGNISNVDSMIVYTPQTW